MPSAPLVAPESPKGRIRQTGSRLLDSALDYALERLWEFGALTLGSAAVTALGLVVLYFRSGAGSWLWPLFTHALSFWAGVFLLMAILVALSWRKAVMRSREEAALQEAKNLRFASDELGFIDFFANKERAEKQLANVLMPVNNEIAALGATSRKFTRKINPNTPFSRRQQLASQLAATFNEHSEKIERQWKTFAELDDVLAESNVGCVNWLNPNDDQTHSLMLTQQRNASATMLTAIVGTLPSLDSFRDTVARQKGASQSLNTAVARLQFVLDGLIGALRKSEGRWRSLIALIDRKTGAANV
jgi:hypothetical protein